ncbi:NAD(P)-binding domain-containing protein [Fodinibius saliphilus]|uniref:NAD(P)-binding domain-containing protein n=1 Tax=Fodinibius saliphilus TaxID=1920650 RepID=UPI001107D97A|nr:NAD(P)-binding domain-containing protein [Fodinibius saliphilus]
MNTQAPVAIIGAGPVGLAAAAHLIERGKQPIIFEAGNEIGYSIKQWQHVQLFSPWEFNVDKASKRLLQKEGWEMPPEDQLPTGKELREEYLLPLASLPTMQSQIKLNAEVTAVSKKNWDKVKDYDREKYPYVLKVKLAKDQEYIIEAKSVIDASGTWFNPNPIGSSGIPAPGEKHNQGYIAYGIPDVKERLKKEYQNKSVTVVGSGHSAMQVVLDLLKLQESHPETKIHWIMRSTNLDKVFGGGEDDQLEARGELGIRARKAIENDQIKLHTPFLLQRIEEIEDHPHNLRITGDQNGSQKYFTTDRIVGTTGFRPDLNMIREVRTNIDPGIESVGDLAPLIDPNIHSCGTVHPHGINELKHPDENFFITGIKSYGRAPNFLLATGYEQVRSIAAYLTGDYEAANSIELNLPDTGVCSTDFILDTEKNGNSENSTNTGCCGTNKQETQQENDCSC